MRYSRFFLFAAAAVCSYPASASVQVIGKGAAVSCYDASKSPNKPTYDQLRQCDRAIDEEGLVLSDKMASHVNRGVLLMRLGKFDAAVRDFDKAIEMDPSHPEAYLNKGSALINLRRPDVAVPLLDIALRNRTRKPAVAYYARGMANEDMGNARLAYLDYRKASTADPKWLLPQRELARFSVKRR